MRKFNKINSSIQSSLMTVLLFAFLLSACVGEPVMQAQPHVNEIVAQGQVLGMYRGMANWIIQQAAAGKIGSEIWINTALNEAIYAVNYHGGVAMTGDRVVVDRVTQTIQLQRMNGGNLFRYDDWSSFRSWMQTNGWVGFTPSGVRDVLIQLGEMPKTITLFIMSPSITLDSFPTEPICVSDTPDGECIYSIDSVESIEEIVDE